MEYSHFPTVFFERVAGSSSHYFEVLVCRACRKTDLFVKLEELERLTPHAILRVPGSAPHR
jgi:hypothetical protein